MQCVCAVQYAVYPWIREKFDDFDTDEHFLSGRFRKTPSIELTAGGHGQKSPESPESPAKWKRPQAQQIFLSQMN